LPAVLPLQGLADTFSVNAGSTITVAVSTVAASTIRVTPSFLVFFIVS
jgi:hypothetical protein